MKRLIMLMSVSLLMLSACGDTSYRTVTLDSFNITHYPAGMGVSADLKMTVSYYYISGKDLDISAYIRQLSNTGFTMVSAGVWQDYSGENIFTKRINSGMTEHKWELRNSYYRDFFSMFSSGAVYDHEPNAILMTEFYTGGALADADTYITNLSGFTNTSSSATQSEYTKTVDGLLYKVRASLVSGVLELQMAVGDPAAVKKLLK